MNYGEPVTIQTDTETQTNQWKTNTKNQLRRNQMKKLLVNLEEKHVVMLDKILKAEFPKTSTYAQAIRNAIESYHDFYYVIKKAKGEKA
jgi:hypothetical protein